MKTETNSTTRAAYTPAQIDEILADYARQIDVASRRRPATTSGASASAPADRLARIIAKRDRFVAMYVEVSA